MPSVAAVDQINGRLLKGISRNVLQLDLMWLTEMLCQVSHIGEYQNHTRAVAMEATYTLQVWPDAPTDEKATH